MSARVPQGRLLSVEGARAAVLEPLGVLAAETVPLHDAQGRVLAEAVRALDASPPFDASEMDGYAVRAADVAGASEARPVVLAVDLAVHAGEVARPLRPGSAAWIATGAEVPAGADAIIPREWTRPGEAPGTAAILRPSAGPGVFIRRCGEDFRPGEEVLSPGVILTPGRVALAASCGASSLRVGARPRVGLISTGDELCEPGASPGPGMIRESNQLLLAGLVRGAGGEPRPLGIVRDELGATIAALENALENDVVVTTGGASVGERDLVREALERLGAGPRFFGVAVKPGKPFAFALARRRGAERLTAVFVLPGNPASALVSFHLFVGPALRRLAGARTVTPAGLPAVLDAPASGAADRRTYLRARASSAGGSLHVRPATRQAAGSIRSLAEANALLVVPAGARLEPGSVVRVEPLGFADLEEITEGEGPG